MRKETIDLLSTMLICMSLLMVWLKFEVIEARIKALEDAASKTPAAKERQEPQTTED